MALDHLAFVRSESTALAEAGRRGMATAPIEACPGWDLTRLVGHVGRVQRWATEAVRTRQQPGTVEGPPKGHEEVVAYLEAASAGLLEALAGLDPYDVVWNFTTAPKEAAFWPRRMAHEAAVHRWDAQRAAGAPEPVDAALAADGIDEIVDVWAPMRLNGRDGIDIGGSVHLHCTDADGEWTFRTDDGVFQHTRAHLKGDVALRGPAGSLLLVLWRRLRPGEGGTEVLGDAAVLDRWLALGAP